MPLPLKQLYHGSLQTRREIGRDIFLRFGQQLLQEDQFQQHFLTLTQYAASVSEHMAKMDLGTCCRRCAAKPSGGCCSLTIAAETDAIQICLNLLAGIDVRQVNVTDTECIYLGKSGCIFIFKPIFCLNYICGQIAESSTAADLSELERLTGMLLTRQYEIERRLLLCLQQASVSY